MHHNHDHIIVIEDSQDASPSTVDLPPTNASLQQTHPAEATPLYILVVFGNLDLDNSFFILVMNTYLTVP